MESAAVLRSFQGALQSVTHTQSFLEKPAVVPLCRSTSKRCLSFHGPVECRKLASSRTARKGSLYVKASETTSTLTSDADIADSVQQGQQKLKNSTFPNGFEKLVLEVCDETDVAELKLKVGDFEMHLTRDIGSLKNPAPIASAIASPTMAPPIPSEPMVESGSAATPQAAPKKSTSEATNPFANISSAKASKLAALEASGNTYVVVSSPTVGLFRSGRTVKGKKQPPICKQGDMIKEGQTIGFLDQFGSELPVRSDAAGEVLRVLYKDGEPVGYGDPLVAILPSFHGIK